MFFATHLKDMKAWNDKGTDDASSRRFSCDAGCSWFKTNCHEHCKIAGELDNIIISKSTDVPKDHHARIYGLKHNKLQTSITSEEKHCWDPK